MSDRTLGGLIIAAALAVWLAVVLTAWDRAEPGEPRIQGSRPWRFGDPWSVRRDGTRLGIYDPEGAHVGWGRVGGDGSVEVFNPDGTRAFTLPAGSLDTRPVPPRRGKGK